MNITILANRDIASNLALNLLSKKLAGHRLRVFLSDKVGGNKVGGNQQSVAALKELKFFEQTLFNELLFPLIDNQPQAATAGLKSFDALGKAIGHPVQVLNQINTPAGLALLNDSEPELVLSVRYGSILKEDAIAIPKHGVLNLHSGLLPQYQGVMATFRALLNGDTEIGSTLHYIVDSSIDTGPVVAHAKITVDRQHSYLWHVLQLYPPGCELMARAVQQIEESGKVDCHYQTEPGKYYTFPTASELDAFEQNGFKLFDSTEILEFCRQFF